MSADQEVLARVQARLGITFPDEVIDQYLVNDGLKGPLDCDLLYNLEDLERANTLKKEEWYPDSLRHLLLVGADGAGGWIAYDPASENGVLWYPADGEVLQECKPSLRALWSKVVEHYADDI